MLAPCSLGGGGGNKLEDLRYVVWQSSENFKHTFLTPWKHVSVHMIYNDIFDTHLIMIYILYYLIRALPELRALPQDSTPTTYYHTRQIRITFIVLVDVSVKSWINIFNNILCKSTWQCFLFKKLCIYWILYNIRRVVYLFYNFFILIQTSNASSSCCRIYKLIFLCISE